MFSSYILFYRFESVSLKVTNYITETVNYYNYNYKINKQGIVLSYLSCVSIKSKKFKFFNTCCRVSY